jgi:hypothetical protein
MHYDRIYDHGHRGDDVTANNKRQNFQKFPVIFPVLRENGTIIGLPVFG